MGINSYNDDEIKFSKLISDLKELPKIKTEENFEYNLMIRIQNQNFGNLTEEKPQFGIIKFVIPSAIVSIIILFVLFLPATEQKIDNPLMVDPPKISENDTINSSQVFSSNAETIIKPKKKINKENALAENPLSEANPSVNPKFKYPINRNRSVALDEYLSGQNPSENNLQRGNIVRSGDEEFDFDGFLLPQPLDKKSLEKYRKMIDSIKKAEAKKDSLRRIR
ncbi:MAG: hypothetical protein QHH13_13100 [Melioribacter sp.]|uniref:hypothetical protein n=1 Tax=Rosettibacter primus TaxID=3111523 RepID=UPI00247D83BB|nr:hypothetical protein [Melioribacter sp.]